MIRPQRQINTLTIWSGVSMASSKSIWHNSDSFSVLKKLLFLLSFRFAKEPAVFKRNCL